LGAEAILVVVAFDAEHTVLLIPRWGNLPRRARVPETLLASAFDCGFSRNPQQPLPRGSWSGQTASAWCI